MESPTAEEPAAVPAVEKKAPHVIIVGAGKLQSPCSDGSWLLSSLILVHYHRI